MYVLNDKQIDFIHDDIRSRGIEMNELQQDLLDHVCCIIEENLTPDGDFEVFYQKTIATFFETDLKEIEEETKLLLTFKNFYKMKSFLTPLAVISVSVLSSGAFFKFMHWPGANLLILLGSIILAFGFLPIFSIVRSTEVGTAKAKWTNAVGCIAAILTIAMGVFRFMHWPFASAIMLSSIFMGIVYIFLLLNGSRAKA